MSRLNAAKIYDLTILKISGKELKVYHLLLLTAFGCSIAGIILKALGY